MKVGTSLQIKNQPGTPTDLLYLYLLASLGFGCLIGWDLIGIFSPALSLLAYCDTTDAIILRLISLASLILTLAACGLKADWLFEHRTKASVVTTALSFGVILVAFCGQFFSIPFFFSVITWVFFGAGSAVLGVIWCAYFSLIPTRRTAVTIAGGSCLGTVLFVVAAATSPVGISLLVMALAPLTSLGLLLFLFRGIPEDHILPIQEYHRTPALSLSASFSVGAHGIVYGFISLLMCLISTQAAIIVGASGIAASLFAIVFSYREPKIDVDNSFIQRVSLPIVVVGLLLIPFFDSTGKIVCGCIVNNALAYSAIMTKSNISVENAEFQLHPIDRYAFRQIPNWIGFFIGSGVAFLIDFVWLASNTTLSFVVVVIAGIVVLTFSIYGADDSDLKQHLDSLLTEQDQKGIEETDAAEVPQYFHQRCQRVITQYELSPREAEIFFLLAKGRNAKYIQEKLCISSSTVKTHIYRIYRKMNINSQQVLIDAVDNERVIAQ
ncbi:MAG: helix-turn-helix transcriptional regulator [Raoultibacter sp.]